MEQIGYLYFCVLKTLVLQGSREQGSRIWRLQIQWVTLASPIAFSLPLPFGMWYLWGILPLSSEIFYHFQMRTLRTQQELGFSLDFRLWVQCPCTFSFIPSSSTQDASGVAMPPSDLKDLQRVDTFFHSLRAKCLGSLTKNQGWWTRMSMWNHWGHPLQVPLFVRKKTGFFVAIILGWGGA